MEGRGELLSQGKLATSSQGDVSCGCSWSTGQQILAQTGQEFLWRILSPFCQQNYSPAKWGKGALWAPVKLLQNLMGHREEMSRLGQT